MTDLDVLAELFEGQRPHLRAVAYRMLGSLSEADDAVQEAWLRASRAGVDGVENVGGWLTTVVGRVCLNLLRSRTSRREDSLEVQVPDPVVTGVGSDPEASAVLGESVGLAMMVVLETLPPDERLAFVLHDVFAVPFDEIAEITEVSVGSARQLASRGRRRVAAAPKPDGDLAGQRAVVDAFFRAARDGDFAGLVAVLDPDVVLRSDGGLGRAGASRIIRGSETLADSAITIANGAPYAWPVLVNGAAGVVVARGGRALSVMGFVVHGGRIIEIDVLTDPERIAQLDLEEWVSAVE